MKTTSALFTSFFATVILAAGPASAAWFMKMDTVPGESMQHPGWIEIQSFSIGGMSSHALESGPRASSPALGGPDTFTLTKRVDKATPNLMKASTERRRFPEVVIECWRAGARQKYMEIKLKEVLISSYQKSAPQQFPTETIKMTYGAIEWTYNEQSKPTTLQAPAQPSQKK